MEGLTNRWKALIQQQSSEELKFSRFTNKQETKTKLKESITDPNEGSKHREPKNQQEKNKNSRTKSSEQRKGSAAKQKESSSTHHQLETPNTTFVKKHEKLVNNYSNAILELLQESQGQRLRPKIRSLIEDLIGNVNGEVGMRESTRVGLSDRAYNDMEQRYLECEKERQYLRGKMEMSAKRYEGLERQLERYSKMQKLIDSSIARQSELRQQVVRVKAQKSQLQFQMQQQKEIFSRQVQSIRSLIQSLKVHLPVN